MNDCPGCGASLRYDIAAGQLVCDHCSSQYDPYEYDAGHNQETGDGSFSASLLSCPNCGAQIMAADHSAAEYCAYCGSFVMLSSSETSGERPDLIVPFGKTKEDCKKIYRRKLAKHIFAPGEFRDPDYLNRFSGFYIPYWVYDVGFARNPRIIGTTSKQEGDYLVTSVFDITGDLNAEFKGITYDASSTFDDNISESIAPYRLEDMKEFTPSYLFGFFANTEDVEEKAYEKSAKELATEAVYERILEEHELRNYKIENKRGTTAVGARIKKSQKAMLPVWFLTWRKKDRIAYSVVNGSTGKIYAEIPIDIRKYLLLSLILTIPLYFLAERMFQFTAQTGMLLGSLLTLAAVLIFFAQMTSIGARNTGFGDYRSKNGPDEPKPISPMFGDANIRSGNAFVLGRQWIIVIAVAFALLFMAAGFWLEQFSTSDMVPFYVCSLAVIGAAGAFLAYCSVDVIRSGKIEKGPGEGLIRIVPWLGPASTLAAAVMALIHPVEDYWYYGVCILSLIVTAVMLVAAISLYNRSVLRPVPNFFARAKEERG